MAPKLTYLHFAVLAITSIYQRTEDTEIPVRGVWAEAEHQSSKVRHQFSSQAHSRLTKGMIVLKNIGLLAFLRDDDDAGRWEDENSVNLTGRGVKLFTQLGGIVVRGNGGRPKRECRLSRIELSRLHTSRQKRFIRLMGRISSTLNILQCDRELRRLTRKKAAAEARLTEIMGKRGEGIRQDSAAPPNAALATHIDTRASTPVAGGLALTPSTPPAAMHSLSGPSRTEKPRRSSPVSLAERPLRRTYNSAVSSPYGGLPSPEPAERTLPHEDMPMDIGPLGPTSSSSPTPDPVTPRAPRTQASDARFAYPSPVSALRPNIMSRTSHIGPRSRIGEVNLGEEAEGALQEQVAELEPCAACAEKDQEIGSLREHNATIARKFKERHEENGGWLKELLSENTGAS